MRSAIGDISQWLRSPVVAPGAEMSVASEYSTER